MGFHALNPGHFTTVQDHGRTGYREWGVPVGGAFDPVALDIANALLGNGPECAALEMTLFGGSYDARSTLAIAIAGAPMASSIVSPDGHERPLAIPVCCTIEAGERLRVGGTDLGVRTYLAVRGGWQTGPRLGSRSDEARIAPGAIIEARPSRTPVRHLADRDWTGLAAEPIRVTDGPDATLTNGLDDWLSQGFRVSRQWDRMGLLMDGPRLELGLTTELLSKPVAPGAIQVAGGNMLVLGVACGTMGGYPHVAHVISTDLARIGQVKSGDVLHFHRVSLEEARAIDRDHRVQHSESLRRLRVHASDNPFS